MMFVAKVKHMDRAIYKKKLREKTTKIYEQWNADISNEKS